MSGTVVKSAMAVGGDGECLAEALLAFRKTILRHLLLGDVDHVRLHARQHAVVVGGAGLDCGNDLAAVFPEHGVFGVCAEVAREDFGDALPQIVMHARGEHRQRRRSLLHLRLGDAEERQAVLVRARDAQLQVQLAVGNGKKLDGLLVAGSGCGELGFQLVNPAKRVVQALLLGERTSGGAALAWPGTVGYWLGRAPCLLTLSIS